MVSSPGPPLPGVSYFSGIAAQDLATLYRQAWVFASPSLYEGFGLPYVEAMASGTAVIATPNPGSREVLDGGRYGVLASDDQFPDRLVQLLLDEEMRNTLAKLGPIQARKYGLESTVDQYQRHLEKVCARTAQRLRVGNLACPGAFLLGSIV
jgi:phosphatidyl-myo-inositol alpha-mannosyltransferase